MLITHVVLLWLCAVKQILHPENKNHNNERKLLDHISQIMRMQKILWWQRLDLLTVMANKLAVQTHWAKPSCHLEPCTLKNTARAHLLSCAISVTQNQTWTNHLIKLFSHWHHPPLHNYMNEINSSTCTYPSDNKILFKLKLSSWCTWEDNSH